MISRALLLQCIKPPKHDLKQKAIKNSSWTAASVFVRVLVQLVTTPILARLISPEHFGYVALASLATEIVALFGQFGLHSALIQRKYIYRRDLNTVFWFNFVVGLSLCVLLIAISGLVAVFFEQPILREILLVTAFGFVINNLGSVHSSILYRTMDFKKIALIEIASTLIRISVALILAFNGYGFWALIISSIVGFVATALFRFIAVVWIPAFQFNFLSFKKLFSFGVNIFGEGLVTYFNNNIDYILVGKRLGVEPLGFYQMAFTMPELIRNNVAQIVSRVVYPMFSRVQDENERFNYGFLTIIGIVAYIAFPILGGMMVVAPEFVPIYFGDKWLAIILPMQLLCISGAFRAIANIFGPVIHSKGKPQITLKLTLAYTPILAVSIYIGSLYGLVGVAAAFSFSYMVLFFVSLVVTVKVIEMKLTPVLLEVLKPLVFTVLMILIVYMAGVFVLDFVSSELWVVLLFKVVIGMFVYLMFSYLFFKDKYTMLWNMIKR